jgi:hypothetical protein
MSNIGNLNNSINPNMLLTPDGHFGYGLWTRQYYAADSIPQLCPRILGFVTDLHDVLGENPVDVNGPVIDNGCEFLDVPQLHRVVQLGRVPPLLPGQRRIRKFDLKLEGGLFKFGKSLFTRCCFSSKLFAQTGTQTIRAKIFDNDYATTIF